MTTLAELQALAARDPVAAARLARAILAEDEVTGGMSYSPHVALPKQAAFRDLDCLEALYGGAAGGGKSDALLMAALRYVDVPGYAAIIFRRTYTELALPDAIMARSHEWLANTDATWSGVDKRWTFPSGASVTFGYLDGPNDHTRYMGAQFQFVGFDELTHFRERQYRYMFSRMRRLDGPGAVPLRMRGGTNPGGVGHDWVKARFAIPDKVDFARTYTHEGRVFIPAKLEDNIYLDQASYGEALAQLDATQLAQLRSGQWVRDTEGLVYREFSHSLVVDALPQAAQWRRILACDFGVVDPTAFVELAFDAHTRAVYVTRADQWENMSPGESAEMAIRWGAECGGYEQIIGDVGGLGKAFQQEWQARFHLPMTAADKTSKLGFIKLLNGDMRAGKVRFLRGTTDGLVDDLSALSWADDQATRENPDQPNHQPDALLYGWRASRHFAAKDAILVPQFGTEAYQRQETDRERARVFTANAKRVRKRDGALSDRDLIRKIARM